MKPKYIIYPLLILLIGYLVYNKFYGSKAKEASALAGPGKKGKKAARFRLM